MRHPVGRQQPVIIEHPKSTNWARRRPITFPPDDEILTHKSRGFKGLAGLRRAPGGLLSGQKVRNNIPSTPWPNRVPEIIGAGCPITSQTVLGTETPRTRGPILRLDAENDIH